jgi:hypothetical protein
MSEQHLSRCIFVIAVLVAIPQLALSGNPVAAAPSAIIVYDHGFAMNVTRARNGNLILINKTSSFTQDDKTVIAFLQAAFYSANLTFNWYSPDGQLYANKTLQLQCATTPCYAAARLFFDWSRTRMPFGRWRLDVLNGGFKLYSDYFYLNSVETQVNDWRFNIESSNSPLVHGELTVTIHPNNGTWSYYRMYIPYANNLTAHEVGSKGNLSVTKTQNDIVVVDLGGPQSAGYSFVIDFNVQYSLQSLNVGGGSFAFAWQDEPWQRFNDPHPIYETFNITLPQGANLVDIVGRNDIALKYDVTAGETQSIGFDTTVISQPFGWTIIYFDSAKSTLTLAKVPQRLDRSIWVLALCCLCFR